MVSVLKRHGAVVAASALLAAGSIAAPTAAAAAPASQPGDSAPAPPKPSVPQKSSPIIVNKNVTYGGGVPVGGWYSLSVYPSGSYNYSGHMHDSGAPSYNHASVCVVRFTNGTAFVFETAGRMHGTFESGSRDYNWNKSGSNPAIRDAWKASGGGWSYSCKTRVNINLGSLVDSAFQVVGYASKVIAIVA
jgi:hypothetical protein